MPATNTTMLIFAEDIPKKGRIGRSKDAGLKEYMNCHRMLFPYTIVRARRA